MHDKEGMHICEDLVAACFFCCRDMERKKKFYNIYRLVIVQSVNAMIKYV